MNNSAPTPPGVAPAAPSFASRFFRATAIAALALALSLLGLLAVATSVPVVRESLGPLVWEQKTSSGAALFVTLAVAVLAPIGALIFCNRRGWLRGPQLSALTLGLLVAFVYLCWDDPAVRRPLTMDELSPALPGDEASYRLLMRYAKASAAANAFKPPQTQLAVAQATGEIVAHPEKWEKFLR